MSRRRPRPWQSPPSGRPTRATAPAGVRRVDLHGYDVLTAVDVTLLTLREAYANGCRVVEVSHGARDVVQPVAAGEGRGGIKWELRRMLDRGQFDEYVSGAEALEASIRFLVRPNPRQRPERWSDLPSTGRS